MDQVILEDQTLRDGLQNESRIFSLEEKMQVVELLIRAGVSRIQLGSFVHPKIVPQMADTDELIRLAGEHSGVIFTALILNEKGLDRALACGIRHVAISVSVSDAHSLRNVNRTSDGALDAMVRLIEKAVSAGLNVRGGLQCVFGCAYQGSVEESRLLKAASAMAAAGASEINLADTTGMANPDQLRRLCALVRDALPEQPLALHLHNTRGLGMVNMLSGFESGIRIFDVCTGGLGGCPFVKGAAGNIPTEDAVHLFESLGIDTRIDLGRLVQVVELLESRLDRALPGHMNRVLKTTGYQCR